MKYIILFFLLFPSAAFSGPLPVVLPEKAGFDAGRLRRADKVIQSSIDRKEIPGAVLIVLTDTSIVYQKAYGNRQLFPVSEKMEMTTVFDLASLTKPIAAATALFVLKEKGMISLEDPVSRIIPGFRPWTDPESGSGEEVRIIHLLTHTAGLPAYPPVDRLVSAHGAPAPDAFLDYVSGLTRTTRPGTSFNYSCMSFVLLQQIIEKISGQTLDEFCREHIFEPLGMTHTLFEPTGHLKSLAAPTTFRKGELLKGIVHDPFARELMGGISGNAGLFSTAGDLAVFTAMLLNNGSSNGKQLLSPLSVSELTTIPEGYEAFGRSPGWDLDSSYSSNQGDLLGKQAYGHTGYTGTSIVIDPGIRTAIILLTNRVHPDDNTSIVRLWRQVANIVAEAQLEKPAR